MGRVYKRPGRCRRPQWSSGPVRLPLSPDVRCESADESSAEHRVGRLHRLCPEFLVGRVEEEDFSLLCGCGSILMKFKEMLMNESPNNGPSLQAARYVSQTQKVVRAGSLAAQP